MSKLEQIMTNKTKLKVLKLSIDFWRYRPQIKNFDNLIQPWLLALQTKQWTPLWAQNLTTLFAIRGRLNYLKNINCYKVIELFYQ